MTLREELGFPSYATDAIEYGICPIWYQVIQATSQPPRPIPIRKVHSVSSQHKGHENALHRMVKLRLAPQETARLTHPDRSTNALKKLDSGKPAPILRTSRRPWPSCRAAQVSTAGNRSSIGLSATVPDLQTAHGLSVDSRCGARTAIVMAPPAVGRTACASSPASLTSAGRPPRRM